MAAAKHEDVKAFESLNYAQDDGDGLASLVFRDEAGAQFVLTCTLKIAAEMAARVAEAMRGLAAAGKPMKVSATPEKIIEYAAVSSPDYPDEVNVILRGERSNPLFGRMKTDDARRLSAVLMVATERPSKKPAN